MHARLMILIDLSVEGIYDGTKCKSHRTSIALSELTVLRPKSVATMSLLKTIVEFRSRERLERAKVINRWLE